MTSIYPIAGLLFVAAITPGPNNILVMQAGLRGGVVRAIPAIVGVVLGSLGLLMVVAFGLAQIADQLPYALNVISIIGASYLAYLGAGLLRAKPTDALQDTDQLLPATLKTIVLFQFLNPKAWVLVSTLVAASHGQVSLPGLAVMMAVITALCLTCWAVLGLALSTAIKNPSVNRYVNSLMGSSLILFACAMVVSQAGLMPA